MSYSRSGSLQRITVVVRGEHLLQTMAHTIPAPVRINAEGHPPKIIEEFFWSCELRHFRGKHCANGQPYWLVRTGTNSGV
jgi:hypothetical protein